MKKKIFLLENLKTIIAKAKNKGKRIVLCHGVFDLLHIGHIKHFEEAKKLGDILVVTITRDKYVNKGPHRPAFNENLRVQAIAALSAVDFVAFNEKPTAVEAIINIKPNYYCKGFEYKNHKNDITGAIKKETNAVKKINGKIIYTQDITFSSSKLINFFDDAYSTSQESMISRIKKTYNFSAVNKLIENFKKIKVLVIGETIIDQYFFCEALGKSGKDAMLVLRDLKMEQYLGGSAAIARHLSSFCKQITLLSMVGENGEFLKEILKKLPKNVTFKYIKKKNSPTIIKKRFLDHIGNHKVFGVYSLNDDHLISKDEESFNSLLKRLLTTHDLIIVSDYGHGLISEKSAKLICKLSKYLALNAQVNAANIGYHSMRKYRNVDCVIINDQELRHELRDKKNSAEKLMKKLSSSQRIKNLIVTRGTAGSLFYSKNDQKFSSCEAYAKKAVDKIGAGDAFLSLAALCLKSRFSKDLSLFIGSLAAAHSAETFGNKEAISKTKILKAFDHILR